MNRRCLALATCLTLFARFASAEDSPNAPPPLAWHSDYAQAYAAAKTEERMLLIHFAPEEDDRYAQEFFKTTSDATVRELLQAFVLLRVPTTYEVPVAGEPTRLHSHASFSALGGKPGLAVIDLRDSEGKHFGRTVSALPFGRIGYYAPSPASVASVQTLLQLPAGSLTQRTMVYAVRLHPERPASTRGRADAYLFSEAAGHSASMARTGVQGHQGFDVRFQRINAAIGGGGAQEVVAESWPGENLVAACFSCVHAWRGSAGHWSAVSGSPTAYGYDIRRGARGIWYATGLFTGG